MAARLCQSLVLGAYSYTLDQDNDYLLQTQEVGWKVLEELLQSPKDEIEELWFTTADNYLKQSSK